MADWRWPRGRIVGSWPQLNERFRLGGVEETGVAHHDAQGGEGHAEMAGQQNEVEGAAEAAVVLPDVSEAMPGPERLQVPHAVRVAPAPTAHLLGEPGQVPRQLLA